MKNKCNFASHVPTVALCGLSSVPIGLGGCISERQSQPLRVYNHSALNSHLSISLIILQFPGRKAGKSFTRDGTNEDV